MSQRPSDGYRNAITDPDDFVGRTSLLEQIRTSPRLFRVLLGGRRIGKTSLLRAIEWRLLYADLRYPRRAFPVFLSLQREQPRSLAHFRYLLVMRLRQAISRWQQSTLSDTLQAYRAYLGHVAEVKVGLDFFVKAEIKLAQNSPGDPHELSDDGFVKALVHTVRELDAWRFEGVCYLIDEAEYIVGQTWSDDAWSYLRSIKDTETALKPFLGFVVSGHRDLKQYRQKVGSPLNIALVDWLAALTETESRELAQRRSSRERSPLSDEDHALVAQWAGSHPFLTQQLLNALFDGRGSRVQTTVDQAAARLLRGLSAHCADWWNAEEQTDGFGDDERVVYRALIESRESDTTTLAARSQISEGRVLDALDVLVGSGVVLRVDEDRVAIGARLFEHWVRRHHPL